MRSIFAACVIIVTLITFYSALWFKSETIEADITERVTDDVADAGGSNVSIDVDGRHVTLSGVVYNEDTERTYLSVADQTYGALGPIDGLTYLTGGGFVKAVKSAEGITLSGSVPSAPARDALVAAATEATDGAVDDQLTIGGNEGDWADEAQYGLAQMAGLSTGALAVTPDSYTLSGAAVEDASGLRQSFADRAGWQTFLSSPTVETGMSARIQELEADVTDRDQTIVDLTGTRDSLTAERSTLAGSLAAMTLDRNNLSAARDGVVAERDQTREELAALRASLTDNQTSIADLTAERDALGVELENTQATLAQRDGTLAERETTLSGLTDQVSTLEARLAAQQSQASGDQSAVAALEKQIADQKGAVETLTNGIETRNARIATLSGNLDAQSEAMEGVEAQVATLTDELRQRDEQEARLDGEVAALKGTVSERDAEIAALQGSLESGESQIPALQGRLTDSEAQVATLQGQLTDSGAQVATLEGQLSDKDDEIAAIQGELAESGDQITALEGRLSDGEGQIAALQGQVDEGQGEIATLRGQLSEQGDAGTSALAQIAALQAQVEGRGTEVTNLGQQVDDLTTVVAERDATIASLRSATGSTPNVAQMAEQCSLRANAVLENARINFATATANIDRSSVETLERLTGIALACAGTDGLTIEIGGHTDSQGSDENNESLSERRAEAIVAFMSERGVPTGNLRAVGYGETQPIADNATAAGRAQNRRISFDWQAR